MPWAKGELGNPSGRPKGSRSKVTKLLLMAFEGELAKAMEETGDAPGSIAALRERDPATFWRIAASLAPKEIDVDSKTPVTFKMTLTAPEQPKSLEQLETLPRVDDAELVADETVNGK